MKRTIRIVFLTALFTALVFGCREGAITGGGSKAGQEGLITWEQIKTILAPGVEVSDERPYPDVLSEKEVLIKFIEHARQEGALHPSYYLYQENPELLDMKLEVPVLLYFIPYGTTHSYIIYGVSDDGEPLLELIVSAKVGTSMKEFETGRAVAIPSDQVPIEYSSHVITKREAAEIIKNQMPGKRTSEPLAIMGLRIEEARYSNRALFWYFTTEDEDEKGGGEEYILASGIKGWKLAPGGMSSRTAITIGPTDSPNLNWKKMARLDTPLRINERLNSLRSAGAMFNTVNPGHPEDVKITPVEWK